MALAGLALGLAGCPAAPFPGSPEASGVRDVPFVDTYNYDFPTGDRSRGSAGRGDKSADLRIFSAADLKNLLAAANVELNPPEVPSGTLNGFTLFGSTPVSGVLLEVMDFDGNPVRDVFYNGLGGVPDFAAADGTADKGSFTIFNVPAGEAFLVAEGGGRGVGHVGIVDRAISVKPLSVIPVVVPEIGITGPITDRLDDSLNVWPVEVSALGLQNQARFSDDRGLLQVTPLVGFRFILPSTSVFKIRGDSPRYETTFQEMDTGLADLGDAVDLTRFVNMVSTATVDAWFNDPLLKAAGITRQPGTGILVGKMLSGQDSPQLHNRIKVKTLNGDDAGFLLQGLGTLREPGSEEAELTVNFVVFNVPPGPVYVRTTSFVQNGGIRNRFAGVSVVDVFADGVTLADIRSGTASNQDNPTSGVLLSMKGVVTLSDLVTPVTNVVIDVAGYPGGPGIHDGPIRSQTSFSGDNFLIAARSRRAATDSFDDTESNLLIRGEYIFKVSDQPGNSSYVDTYQVVPMAPNEPLANGSLEMVENLEVFTRTELETMAAVAGITLDPSRGVLIGRALDVFSLTTPANLEIAVLDQNGNSVGEVRYMDDQGLPQKLDSTSSRGEFVAFNVPEGVVLIHVVSKDDSGSLSTRVFAGGVTSVGRVLVADAPVDQVAVAGTVRGVDGTPITTGATLTFRGEKRRDQSGVTGYLTENSAPDGSYNTTLGVVGRYITSVFAGDNFYRTHNLDVVTSLFDLENRDLMVVERDRVSVDMLGVLATDGRNLTLDPDKGIVTGQVVVKAWEDGAPVSRDIAQGVVGPTAVAAVRLNGDSKVDLVVANGDSDEVTVYFSAGNNDFNFVGTYPVGLSPVDLIGMDLDADGVGDILVLNQGSSDISVLLGTVRGVFREDTSRRLQVGTGPVRMARGDMDGDGSRDDLVVLNRSSNSLSVFFRDEDRRFVEASYSPFALSGSQPSALVVRELNKKESDAGRLNAPVILDDIVVTMEGSGVIETYFNAADTLVRQPPLPLASSARPVDLLVTDINGDGVALIDRDLERIVLNQGLNNVQVIETVNGQAQFIEPGMALDVGCVPTRMKLEDINGDGRRDLVILCAGDTVASGWVAVYLGHEDGLFSPWQCAAVACPKPPLFSGKAPLAVDTGDLDVEPGTDLVVANRFSDSVTVYFAHDVPQAGIELTLANLEGDVFPDLVYLDRNGVPIRRAMDPADPAVELVPAGGSQTDGSGRFIALNLPPGEVWASAIAGDNGNRRFIVRSGEVTQGLVRVVVESPLEFLTLTGQVNDAVGSPQAEIEVCLAGSASRAISTDDLLASGIYTMEVPSNQADGVVWLRQRNVATGPCRKEVPVQ